GRCRKSKIDRHRYEAGAQDSVVGGEKLGAVGGEDADPLAAPETARRERARHAVRHRIEPAVAHLARRLFAAEIDERDLVEIALALDQIAEVGECSHNKHSTSSCPAKAGHPVNSERANIAVTIHFRCRGYWIARFRGR